MSAYYCDVCEGEGTELCANHGTLYCNDCQSRTVEEHHEAECPSGCECHDSPAEHDAWSKERLAYWNRYFGQDHGTKEERRARLEAMDPRPVSDEQMDEYRRLK